MIIKVRLLDPRTVQGHKLHPNALLPEVVATLPSHVHIDTESLGRDAPWCPGGRVWEIIPEDVAKCMEGDPNCIGPIRRGSFICEHMIEIGD